MKRSGIVGLGAFFAVTALLAFSYTSPAVAQMETTGGKAPVDRIGALKKFTDVLGIIERYYVDEISLDELVKKAVSGLLANLDAHSGYMDEKQYKELKIQTEGEFGGLGITVGMKNDALTVISPIDGTPAFKVGMKAGDVIMKIDAKSTMGMNMDEAVSLMRGKPGTKVKITVYRKGEGKPLIFDITRDIIKVDSVKSRMIEGNILYTRISTFDKNVADLVRKDIEKNEKSLKGVVLDLRNNPGGLLDQAVELSDLFIDNGIIVSQKGRSKEENIVYEAKSRGTYKDIPIVVLINEGSASASEIVSGALQDHKRAVLVGEKTFGKGSVQVVLPMSQTEAIRLTIARYYLPSGRTIQAVGVTPDIVVKQGIISHEADNDLAIKEADLKDHLKNEMAKVEGKETNSTKKEDDLSRDLQLQTALGVLKGLIITKSVK